MSCGGLSFPPKKISFFAEKLVESVLKACGLCASIRWQDDAEAGLPAFDPKPHHVAVVRDARTLIAEGSLSPVWPSSNERQPQQKREH